MHTIYSALHLLLIICAKQHSASTQSDQASIYPFLGPVIKVPSESFPLSATIVLRCALILTTPVNSYESQWRRPGDAREIEPTTNDRYTIEHDIYHSVNEEDPDRFETKLIIDKLSYLDTRVYICSARRNATFPWISATIDLQLEIVLLSKFNETLVLATTNDSTVEVSCEMRAFIRPDSFLIWEGPDGQRVTSDGKYQITVSSGSNDTAVDGSQTLVPSRVSTLTVHDPEKSDQGVYTCSVVGTNQTIELMIMVNDDVMHTTQEVPSGGKSSLYQYVSYTALMFTMVASAGVLPRLSI